MPIRALKKLFRRARDPPRGPARPRWCDGGILEDLDGGRFAGAVGPEQREYLPRLDDEGETVQDLALPVGLPEIETAIAVTEGEDTDAAL